MKLFFFAALAISLPVFGAEFYVAPGGIDSSAGDAAHPFRTIAHAVTMAKSGDMIWLHAGVYRESIDIRTQGTQPLTIAAMSGEKARIFGSMALTTWQEAHHTNLSVGSEPPSPGISICTTQLPFGAVQEGQLFIDDQPALLEKGPLPEKRGYAVIPAPKSPGFPPVLAVRLADGDLAGKHHFEWATAHSVIVAEGNACPVHLKGLDIAYANNGKQEGMVVLCSPGSSVENCVVRDSAARGISICPKGTVSGCHVYGHGILGIGSAGGDSTGVKGMQVADCEIDHNAWNNADTGWEAGGIKLSSAHDAKVMRNRVQDNQAWGIWFDWQCVGNRIEGNICQRNVAGGIFLEASRGRNVIANNICTDTRQDPRNDWGDGIFSHDSSDALVEHNLCWHNAAFGIRFRLDSDRKLEDGKPVECSHNVLENNVCAGNGAGQLALPSGGPLTQENKSDDNVLFAENASQQLVEDSVRPNTRFVDFASWQKLGFDRNSLVAEPGFLDASQGDYRPRPGAPQMKVRFPPAGPAGL